MWEKVITEVYRRHSLLRLIQTAHGGVHVRWIPGWLPYLQTPAANCFIKLEFDYCAFTELSGAPTVYNVSLESTKIHSD